jgi:ribose transport system ATP-binding protein
MIDSNECLLETDKICKEFSSVPVLKDINIGIFSGEILGIIGENGAGKSTLMKIFSGIYTPTSGDIPRATSVSKGKRSLFPTP